MMGGDHFGYYMYLPATFIQHDLKDLRQTIYERDNSAGYKRDSSKSISDVGEVYFYKNIPVIKYTCGVAMLELPPFIVAHILAPAFHQARNGFSTIYIFSLHLWNLLFAFAGIVIVSFALKEFFTDGDWVIAISVFAIAIATNLYHFVAYKIGLSHPYLFTLYALLLLATIRFYKTYSFKDALLIGLSAGMISLVRPNEIICLVIPFLYGIRQISGFKERFVTLIKSKSFYLAIIVYATCAVPQLIYWKSLTGHWLYYSYGPETFDFKNPKIYAGLFEFKNGWLPYTPIMIFTVIGLVVMVFRRNKMMLATLVFVPLHIYIIYSWWCWNYINGLGSRPMIEAYAILSIPLAVFTQITLKSVSARSTWLLCIAFFAAQQIMMTYQTSANILWSEDSNWVFYKTTLFKPHINMNDLIVYDTHEEQPKNVAFNHNIYFEAYTDSIDSSYVRSSCDSSRFSFLLDSKIRYTPALRKTLRECGLHPKDWIKISFENCNMGPRATLQEYAAMCAQLNRSNGQMYKWVPMRIQNKLQSGENFGIWYFPINISGRISFFTQIPETARPEDELRVFGCNFFSCPVAISNLSVDAYN